MKGSTPKESFEKKQERDTLIDTYFKELKYPLIRISHFHFARITKEEFDLLIEKSRKSEFIRTYKIFKKEVPDKIRQLIEQGKT